MYVFLKMTQRALGLTGSIGMGKTTVGRMLEESGLAVFDSDACVHKLYGAGGEASTRIAEVFGAHVLDARGGIDRASLSKVVMGDAKALATLESIVHPLVRRERQRFKEEHKGEPLIVYDIPLLYETGAEKEMDLVMVVSCDAHLQRARVMARPGMTAEKFEAILMKQLPDQEKRKRAHFVIETNVDLDTTRKRVERVIEEIKAANL